VWFCPISLSNLLLQQKAILAAIAIAEIEELTQVALAEIAEKLDDQDREEVESYQV
jgi:hypothetical protein